MRISDATRLFHDPVAALDKFLKSLSKSGCWSTIDDIVVKTSRDIEVFTDFYLSLNNTRLL